MTADHEGRIEARPRPARWPRAGGGGLAVRAGDRDATAQAHQLGQHERACSTTGSNGALAQPASGLSACTAVDVTTASTSATCAAAGRRAWRASDAGAAASRCPFKVEARDDVAQVVTLFLGDAAHYLSRQCRRNRCDEWHVLHAVGSSPSANHGFGGAVFSRVAWPARRARQLGPALRPISICQAVEVNSG